MKKCFYLLSCLAITAGLQAQEQKMPGKKANQVLLSNGWSLSPAGRSLPLGDLPLNMAVSPSRKWIAVTNNGQSVQSLQLIDTRQEKILAQTEIPKSWYGLRFSRDERFLYASGGHDNWILKYAVTSNRLQLVDSLKLGARWPVKIAPAGIELDEARNLMYVVTREDQSLYIINLKSKAVIKKLPIWGEGYACLLAPSGKELYISCWGCDKLIVFNTVTQSIAAQIPVGDNPNEICLSKNGNWLYVANANDNSVSVIDIRQRKVRETLNAALYPWSPSGSTTNGLCLSEDESRLYIANADNNCLSVFDVRWPGQSRSMGFIPVGWYPTNVKAVNNKIWVTNGKGFSSMANPFGPSPVDGNQKVIYQNGDTSRPIDVQYIGGLFKGTMSIIDNPNEKDMAVYSKQVYDNVPYSKKKEQLEAIEPGNPVPARTGAPSPIKHIFYIIKENRTYDQMLGDMKEGNGDPSLVLFGEKNTPNQHAIARQFVLLDNFYVDAEVSADGHNWSLGGYATDYLEKTWPSSYGGRGGSYDAEGTRAIANNKGGFLWDNCKRHGVSYRTYGEFADDYKANIPVLKGHFCPYYTSWDQKVMDTTRFSQWKRDFDSLLAIGKVPQLNTLRMINDHTEGL
ncbi:MAG TPA: beta-propeller fold lactonase family protein, partial [Flavisolibacter sp.]|nr:beta-propeller fold lactonase family protein [Flavisolibacter sp.]